MLEKLESLKNSTLELKLFPHIAGNESTEKTKKRRKMKQKFVCKRKNLRCLLLPRYEEENQHLQCLSFEPNSFGESGLVFQ